MLGRQTVCRTIAKRYSQSGRVHNRTHLTPDIRMRCTTSNSHAHAKCFWWKTSPSVWVTCTRLILITDKRRWRGMERKKSREWEGQKNIFTSLHGGSLSPRGVVRKGRAALLTAFMASGCERGGGMEDRPLTWNSYNPARLTAPVGLMSTIGKWISTTVMTLSQRLDVTEQVHF